MRKFLHLAALLLTCIIGTNCWAQTNKALVSLQFPTDVPTGIVPDSQVFLDNVPDPTVLIGHVSWVWNSEVIPFSKLVPSYTYWPVNRNNINVNNLQCTGCVIDGTNPYLDWFISNQPTYIEYLNDRHTPAWADISYNYVPLAITNPGVFDFVTTGAGSGGATTNWMGLLHNVYPGGLQNVGIALDNVTIENNQYQAGHYVGTPDLTLCTEADPSCGGTLIWQQDFCKTHSSGTFPYCTTNVDSDFDKASVIWTGQLQVFANSQGGRVMCNNEATSDVSDVTKLALVCGDTVLTEGPWLDGPFNASYCTGGSPAPLFVTLAHDWFPRWQYYRNVNAAKGFAPVDYLCGGVNPPNEPHNQVAWGVGNFLLDRGGKAAYSARDGVSGGFGVMPSYFNPPCGTADWNAPSTVLYPWSYPLAGSGGGYERILGVWSSDPAGTKVCYIEVNPKDSGNTTYVLPGGHTYQDQFGNSVSSGSNTLGPSSAIVILQET